MKKIGDYYFWKYNTRDIQDLVKRIIERYQLNKDLDMKDRVYLVNPHYLETKLKALMSIPGEIGFTIRVGLFTGLREEDFIIFMIGSYVITNWVANARIFIQYTD